MDLNNDGKKDVVAGDTEGNVWLFLNNAENGKPTFAAGEKLKADGKTITEGSNNLAKIYSKIHLADWDADGLIDLLIGHDNTIIFYKNAGTKEAPDFKAPVLIEIAEGSFPSRPSPYVVDWDGDGKLDLLSGSESSKVTFYRNVGTATEPKLAKGVDLGLKGGVDFTKGYRCRIEVTDWNNDGKLDILVGNFFSHKSPMGGNIWLFLGK